MYPECQRLSNSKIVVQKCHSFLSMIFVVTFLKVLIWRLALFCVKKAKNILYIIIIHLYICFSQHLNLIVCISLFQKKNALSCVWTLVSPSICLTHAKRVISLRTIKVYMDIRGLQRMPVNHFGDPLPLLCCHVKLFHWKKKERNTKKGKKRFWDDQKLPLFKFWTNVAISPRAVMSQKFPLRHFKIQ